MLNVCKQLVEFWLSASDSTTNVPDEFKDISTIQLIEFLSLMLEKCPISIQKLKNMNLLYKLDEIRNSEIRFRWLRLCMLSKWDEKINDALAFVNSQGRMKFVRPLYRDMYAWEAVREKAINNFKQKRNYMMYVSAYTVSKDLKIENL